MFSTIVVPLDGSEIAEAALSYAKDLAVKSKGILHLMRVSSADMIINSLGGYSVPQSIIETQLQVQKDYLARIQEQLEGEGLSVKIHLEQGDPSSSILALAQQEHSDLIVMTSHGRSGISRFLMGSVAERLCRHAQCPVLVVGHETLKGLAERQTGIRGL